MGIDTFAAMTTARERVTAILDRHDKEREELIRALREEERAEANDLRSAVNADAGSRLAEALRDIEKQLRRDAKNGTPITARVVDTLPGWAPRHMPALDDDDKADGRKSVIVFMPRADASSGLRDRVALALVDVSKAVFGTDR